MRDDLNKVLWGALWLIKRQNCFHIDISQLIFRANHLAGFYMMTTLAFNGLTMRYFCKNTKRRSENMLRGFLQKYWKVFCKNTNTCFQIQWQVFRKCTDAWSAKILRCFAKILSGIQHSATLNNLLVKTQGFGLFSVTSWPLYFRRPKVKKQPLRTKSFANFWYPLKHEKGETEV